MKLWPFAFIGRPELTPAAHKRTAWADLEPKYRITCPVDSRKQWKPVQITKRRPS